MIDGGFVQIAITRMAAVAIGVVAVPLAVAANRLVDALAIAAADAPESTR